MADQYQKPYIDSSVFIGWIKGEVIDGVDRKAVADHILYLAESKTYRITISALTLAEVHKKRRMPALTEEEDKKILLFFEHEYFDLVDVDREIGEQANQFCRAYGLMPNDAIHLACALRAGCDVLLSWDAGLNKVVRPDIRLEMPQILGQPPLFNGMVISP